MYVYISQSTSIIDETVTNTYVNVEWFYSLLFMT
jgi:hypothetical protein